MSNSRLVLHYFEDVERNFGSKRANAWLDGLVKYTNIERVKLLGQRYSMTIMGELLDIVLVNIKDDQFTNSK